MLFLSLYSQCFKLFYLIYFSPDPVYKLKLKNPEIPVESCHPNPCQNGGKCLPSQVGKHSCQCIGHFTGKNDIIYDYLIQ